MKDKQKHPYAQMRRIADVVLDMLAPHCERIEIVRNPGGGYDAAF